ncbi:MAG: hypothetical protein ACPG4Q_11615 [Phycisphaeraceae bacterium]
MPKPFAILLVGAVLLQSLFGAVAGAGTICLGGGHEHPQEAATESCELDCSHATQSMPLPAAVGEPHGDCSCVDLDLSIAELLTPLPRLDAKALPDVLLPPVELFAITLVEPGYLLSPPPVPKWFDPSGTQRIADLSTTRLIV